MPGSGINRSNIINFRGFDEVHGTFNRCLKYAVNISKTTTK